jgi:glyoxylase-like metal-dependent hydrolase (beta-lactamase superfamily II)
MPEDELPQYVGPDPVVEVTGAEEVARDLVVVPNRGIQLVPNVGVIGGSDAVLVVETGMGPRSADRVLKFAQDYAKGRRLYLTTTHFHPEHAFGAQVFAGEATYVVNRAQADDLASKGGPYLGMFAQLGPQVARELEGVKLVTPDVIYDGSHELDLGGRVVHLEPTGRGHTKGDQVITVPDVGLMFTGDLVESRQFPIVPYFPPFDTDVSALGWIAVMERLIGESPQTVVPGHGAVGNSRLLVDVRDYITELRDETWRRRDSSMSEEEVAEEVSALMVQRHPDWVGQEMIVPGVECLYSEHVASRCFDLYASE